LHICLYLDDVITPWEPTNRTDLWPKVVSILGCNASL